jgi:membrane fusion protein (multidrug efflux system)
MSSSTVPSDEQAGPLARRDSAPALRKNQPGRDQESEHPDEQTPEQGSTGKQDEKKKGPPVFRRPAFLIATGLVLILLLVGGVIYWLHARHYVSTDDAYIDGHVSPISPQVPAPIRVLHITDNQFVEPGDLMVELDPTDYQVALDQSKAQVAAARGRLAQAQAQVGGAKAAVLQAAAEIDAAQVAFDNASRDLKRYQEVDERARSRQQLDNVTAAQKNAQAQLEQTKARKTSAEANVDTSEASVKAADGELQTALFNVKRAEVNLSYCRIVAPCAGRVTQRTADVGAYAQTGQAMFLLVSPDVWVTANFKETQLKNMQLNQPVTVTVDAFPGLEFKGHVDSIQAGSGSRFSVLPAENATGNFVKIVQRVPVKIVFDHGANTNEAQLLSPGLSVIPKVKVL